VLPNPQSLVPPVIREMARMLLPSTITPRIWARLSVVSLFILTNMLEKQEEIKLLLCD
jgi:hypothetical protein